MLVKWETEMRDIHGSMEGDVDYAVKKIEAEYAEYEDDAELRDRRFLGRMSAGAMEEVLYVV